jgi:CBS domain-containing protein
VQEIMTRPAVTCLDTDTLDRPAQQMWDHDCGAIPVIRQDGRIIGVVTDRDICMAAYTQGLPLRAIRVQDAMARKVFACRPEDTLEQVEKLMSEKQIRRLPVVDEQDRPVGIVSVTDIARQAAASRKQDGREQVTATIAAIGRPRGPQREAAGP